MLVTGRAFDWITLGALIVALAERLNTANPTVMAQVTLLTMADGSYLCGDLVHAHAAALRGLWALTMSEAQTPSYADAFTIIMVCFLIATPMVPLMRKVEPPKAPPADAD